MAILVSSASPNAPPAVTAAQSIKPPRVAWRALVPIAVTLALALLPHPTGLAPHAWYYFAIFAGVIVALMLEPLPGGAIGWIGITIVAVLAPYVLFSPEELAKPGFKAYNAALTWGLSGFANTTVWLIFGAFMFALGYDKTGLGRRIALLLVKKMGRRTLTLGYAIAASDTILAPFTPSNTARSGGTIYPVIRNLPALYDSKPNDPSARRIGSYLMWVAIATTCVTSSMFVTAMAPNLLAMELVNKSAKAGLTWMQWFVAFAPIGIALLILIPLVTYWLYPPEVKSGEEVPKWAAVELEKMGALKKSEIILTALVALALALWIFGGDFINATTVALAVISLMLVLKVVSWEDMVKNSSAWNTLAWFATLVALADGLSRVGFVKWFADAVGAHMAGFPPFLVMIALLLVFYFTHYLFASVTAHVTAMVPVFVAVGMAVPGIDAPRFALLMCLTLGIMGVLTPYATGPSPVYYGSGYLPTKDYWRLGAVFGVLFIAAMLLVGVPWLAVIR